MSFHRIGNISNKHDWITLYPCQIETNNDSLGVCVLWSQKDIHWHNHFENTLTSSIKIEDEYLLIIINFTLIRETNDFQTFDHNSHYKILQWDSDILCMCIFRTENHKQISWYLKSGYHWFLNKFKNQLMGCTIKKWYIYLGRHVQKCLYLYCLR